ncbi:unnamed protein product [Spirodela intermedia]|uniref:Uncharacterized protein n=1 Tax=Spirodela intermedia TaxID=51605 RepID=A0A7I8IYB7_SPIIN|nr:unnamed protein product [Spirodela intermedia]CAA6662799.1 unnamed protein product [Spirodela intermedia]
MNEGPKWTGCHVYGGPHRSADSRLNPILAQNQPPPVIEEALRKLLFVEAIINSTSTKALVDSRVTHNFLSEKEAHRLGLSLVRTNNKIKAINSEAQTSVELAHT